MNLHEIRHLPVLDANNQLAGIMVDRELAVIEAIPGILAATIPTARAMRPALSVSDKLPVDEAIELMMENDIDCAVVRAHDGSIEGIFTVVDALEALAPLARATKDSDLH